MEENEAGHRPRGFNKTSRQIAPAAAKTIKGLAMDSDEKANSRDSWYADEAG